MAKSHARYGPSSLSALTKCLRFKYSDIDEDAAAEGTELHAAVETGNLAGLNDEQRAAVQNIIDYVESLKEGSPDDWYHLKEARIVLEDLTFGTADIVLVHKTRPVAHVADAKFTRTEGDHDLQVRTYGAALVEMILKGLPIRDHDDNVLLDTRNFKQGLETVTTHVVAPRTWTIDAQKYNAKQLLVEVRAEIEELYERIDDPFLPPTPHESLCGKCARASKCPALHAVARVTAKGIGLPVPETFSPEAMVSVEDRAKAQVIAGALVNWATQIKKQNNEFAKLGGELPGFTLRSRSTGLRLPKEYTAIAMDILKEAGFKEHMLLECCSLTLGELSKQRARSTGATEAEVKEKLRELLSEWTTEGETQFLQKSKRISDDKLLEQLNQ